MLSDMFTADQRGKAISIYSAAPLIGPVIGPIAGAWIAQETTWRWVFRSSTIADALVQLIGLWFLKESESSEYSLSKELYLISSLYSLSSCFTQRKSQNDTSTDGHGEGN